MLAVLSLGSCMGDSVALMRRAAGMVEELPRTSPVARSSIYETAAVDVPEEFRDIKFLNAVMAVETELTPAAFSDAIHAIEAALGRRRSGIRHEPRNIDIDIVAFGDCHSDDPALMLPHPEAARRRFVMEPLAEILPDYILPGQGKAAGEIAAALASQEVSRLALQL